jgi:diacylglycerol kinase (ATP)
MISRLVYAIKHFGKAFIFTCKGLGTAFRREEAFRQEVLVLIVVVPLGIILGDSGVERALLIGSWIFVLAIELTNSAIESTVDRISREHNKLSGRAKDYGSAAVFCSIIAACVIWLCILIG